MFAIHPASAYLRTALASASIAVLDSAQACSEKSAAIMDAAGSAELANIRAQAVSTLLTWASTPASDLDEGEKLADRLYWMFVGLAGATDDAELTDDEADLVQIAMDAGFDYLTSKGVSDADASALLNDGDEGAAERIAELLSGNESGDEIDSFAFDAESQASLLDSAIFDAVYKKTMVVRGGRKVRVNKRVSGTVRLSAAQKVAIRKAGMKSHSAGARMHRLKSVNLRAKFGLK